MALDIGTLVGFLKLDTSDWDKSSDKADGKGKAFAKKAAVWGAAAAAGLAAAGKVLYDLGGRFDDVTDTIRVGTGATGKALDGLSDSAKKIATEVPASFEDSAAMVADLNTRLGLTGPRLERVAKQMLEAGRLTGEAIDTQTMTGALAAFDVKGKGTSKVLDDLWRVSQATGLGMNELASQVARNGPVMKQFGFGISDSAALLGTLDKAGLDGNRTMATLSRAMVAFAKEGRDPKKALGDTVGEIEKLTKAGKDAEAVNIAAKVFGTRGASQFVAAVKAGKVNLDDLMGATGTTSDTILKASKDTADFAEKWDMFKNKVLLKLEPVAARVFNAMGDGLDKITPVVEAFFQGMEDGTGAGGRFADILETVGDVLGKVLGFIVDNKEAVAVFAGVILTVVAALKIWAAVQAALNLVMAANPVMLVGIAIAALAAGIIYAYQHSETFRGVIDKVGQVLGWLWDNILKPLGSFIVDVFVGYLKTLANMWLTMAEFGVRAFTLLLRAAFAVFDGILSAAEKGLGWIPGLGGKIKGARRAFDEFGNATIRKLEGVADKIRGVRDDLNGLDGKKASVSVIYNVSQHGKVANQLARFGPEGVGATGAVVNRPTLALIGEAGPEAVVPLNRTRGNEPLPEFGHTAPRGDAPLIGRLEVVAQAGATRREVHDTISAVVYQVGLAARSGRWAV